jgi:hypothetical protein
VGFREFPINILDSHESEQAMNRSSHERSIGRATSGTMRWSEPGACARTSQALGRLRSTRTPAMNGPISASTTLSVT